MGYNETPRVKENAVFPVQLKTTQEPTKLDAVIDDALSSMEGISPYTEEYAKTVEQLSKLYKFKEQSAPKRVSPDKLAEVAGSLAGILLVLNFERLNNIVTSKAFGLVTKLGK